MYTARITPDILEHRLDCSFYNPTGLAATRMLFSKLEVDKLANLIDQKRTITNGVRGPDWATSEFKLIRLQDCEHWIVNSDEAASISKSQFEENRRCKLKVNDIVVAIGGYIGNAAVVVENCEAVIGQHSAVLPEPEQTGSDSRFLVAYLNSKFAEAIFSRYVSGTVQAGINLEDLRDLPAPRPNGAAQKYVGDKVRQAERLRAWANTLDGRLNDLESRIPLQRPVADEKKHSKAELSYLTDNRLDAKFYERKHLALDAQFNNAQFRRLGAITSSFKYGASVTADYVSQNDGITFIRGNAISKNNINAGDIVYLHRRFLDDVSGCRIKVGEVLITRSGTVGVTCDVFDEFNGAAYGSFIIKCQPCTGDVLPTYLAWFLNSWAGQQQFRRWENGAVQLNINIEELSSIMIWLAPSEIQNQIVELIESQRESEFFSRNLTIAAKYLVEALIEGQLTEAELIAAEQALQTGNDQFDRRILNRLKTDGIDGQGPTLFSDLDELYRLLAQAETN